MMSKLLARPIAARREQGRLGSREFLVAQHAPAAKFIELLQFIGETHESNLR
jgi:hypothetical protein